MTTSEARRAATENQAANEKRPDLVICGLDASAWSHNAADWAASEAVRRHATLELLHAYEVVNPFTYGGAVPAVGYPGYIPDEPGLGKSLHAEGLALLERVGDELRRAHPGLSVRTRLVQGDPVTALRIESGRAGLTVLGSHGTGRVASMILGSVALSIAAHNPAPVALIHPDQTASGSGPVVVGVDESPNCEAAVAFAFEEAALRRTNLVAVHSWNDSSLDMNSPDYPVLIDAGTIEQEQRVQLARYLAQWRKKYPQVPVEQAVVHGRPMRALLEHGLQAQLVVVGTRGRGAFLGVVLGSTSQSLIAHSACPVVVVSPGSPD